MEVKVGFLIIPLSLLFSKQAVKKQKSPMKKTQGKPNNQTFWIQSVRDSVSFIFPASRFWEKSF